jgi:hypothetical protein
MKNSTSIDWGDYRDQAVSYATMNGRLNLIGCVCPGWVTGAEFKSVNALAKQIPDTPTQVQATDLAVEIDAALDAYTREPRLAARWLARAWLLEPFGTVMPYFERAVIQLFSDDLLSASLLFAAGIEGVLRSLAESPEELAERKRKNSTGPYDPKRPFFPSDRLLLKRVDGLSIHPELSNEALEAWFGGHRQTLKDYLSRWMLTSHNEARAAWAIAPNRHLLSHALTEDPLRVSSRAASLFLVFEVLVDLLEHVDPLRPGVFWPEEDFAPEAASYVKVRENYFHIINQNVDRIRRQEVAITRGEPGGKLLRQITLANRQKMAG